jgi:enediyne biosynthesis protein E4
VKRFVAITCIVLIVGVIGAAALLGFGVVGSARAPDLSDIRRSKNYPSEQATLQYEPSQSEVPTNDLFQDVTGQTGIEFRYRNGQEAGHCTVLESLGGGVAAVDYDGDGYLDLYLIGGGQFTPDERIEGLPNRLYRNLGDWRFELVSDEASITDRGFGHGCTVGDYDNDGFPDLLVTHYEGVLLERNNGDGTFRECAVAAGLTDSRWGTGAAWGDFDEDGSLDLFICHYVNWSFSNHLLCGETKGIRDVCTPRLFSALGNSLFHNNNDGTFEDITSTSGIRSDGKSLGVVVADLDGDGHVDIYVANDTSANHLYWNCGNGTFDERGIVSGTALGETGVEEGSMGVDADDYNGDGQPDLWTVNFEDEPNALYRNEGGRIFTHVSESAGLGAVSRPCIKWGTGFFDIDNDGLLDIFVSNGHMLYQRRGTPMRQKPFLFKNNGSSRFIDISSQGGEYFRNAHIGRGTALADLDNDGHIDLVLVHQNDPCALLQNRSSDGHGWVRVALVGTSCNRDAVGAVLTADVGGRRLMRLIKGGGSYLSHSDRRVLFGLGAEQQVEQLEIRWPGGPSQNVRDLAGEESLKIVQGRKPMRIIE